MKKWLPVFMAVALTMAMVIPAMAEPNLSVTGEYTLQGMTSDGVASQNSRAATTDDNDKRSYFYQRMRVQPQIKASDNVSANLRFDFAEGIWGQDQNFSAYRADYGSGQDIQVDRAYVDINSISWLRVRAGLQFIPAGQTQVYRDNQPALQFNIKTGMPLSVRLAWVKAMEGIGTGNGLEDEEDNTKDMDRYLVDLGYKADVFSVNLFGVMQTDGGTGDTNGDGAIDDFEEEPWVVGLRFKGDFGALGIHGELAQFGGDTGQEDNAGNGIDYTGTQFNVNGMYTISDALKVGIDLIYSSAQGDDEKKMQSLGNPFASYDIRLGGAMGWDTQTYGRANGFLYSGTGGPLPGDVFDPFNTGAGAMTAGLGAMYTPLSWLSVIGQFHYMVAADDELKDPNGADIIGEFEKGYNILLAAVFQIAPKTDVRLTYQRVDASFMDDLDPDASSLYGAHLRVRF